MSDSSTQKDDMEVPGKIESMDLDELQEEFGGISRYQIVLILVVSILPFGTCFMSQTSVFFSAVPEYRCSVPPIDDKEIYPSLTEDNITNLLIPVGKFFNSKYSVLNYEDDDTRQKFDLYLQKPEDSCSRYAYNLTECTGGGDLSCVSDQDQVETMECDNGFTYDDTYYEETTVSEWDLVCGRRTLDSVANSLYFFGVFVGSGIIGPLMDWTGRKMTMLIMCIALVASGVACTFSPTYEVYIALRVFVAAAGIPCFVAYYTYVSEITDKKGRTFVGMYAQLISGISHTVLPGLAYFLRDWRELSLACSLLPLPYVVIHFFIPRSPRWLLSKNLEDEARITVERYAKSKGKTLDDNVWDTVVRTEQGKLKNSSDGKKYVISDLFRPPLMRMVSFNVMYLWFVVSMIFYGLTLNVGTLVGDPYVNSTLNALVEIIGYLGYYFVCSYLGRRLTSSGSYLLSGVCCLTTMLLSEFADGNDAMIEASRWVAITGKLFATVAFAIVYQHTSELYPTVARGTGMSMGSMAARVGSIIMPFTLQIQEAIPWLTQTIFGTLAIIAGLTSLLLPETGKSDLTSTIDEAENFYRKNMPFTAKLMGKTGPYKAKSKKSQMELGQDNTGYEDDASDCEPTVKISPL